MAQRDEVVNSCRVCRSLNQDGDFECLYAVQVIEEGGVIQSHTWQLTDTGKLYEDTLGVEIDASTMEVYPQYFCNSCDLQMRLFRKLTMRARRTLDELAQLYPRSDQKVLENERNIANNAEQINLETAEKRAVLLDDQFLERGIHVEFENERNDVIEALLAETANASAVEQNGIGGTAEQGGQTFAPIDTDEATTYTEATSNAKLVPTEGAANEVLNELQVVALNSKSIYDDTLQQEAAANSNYIKAPKKDTKEIEFVSFYDENHSREEESPAVLKEEPIEFFDVHYLEDTNSSLPIKVLERPKNARACNGGSIRRAYECQACSLEFLRRTDFLQHRKTMHYNKFPCPLCWKLLHTNDALRVHLRLHSGQPAYKCDLCQRTFNQKVHYRYHMDRHNNVRNFKCTQCEKAFLSKHDLTVHTRTHTGERPYECEICGKDFLILQHLKMHRYSHTSKSFECGECKQKFISPSTLSIHQHTIHNSERRFQCEFCVKRFRRKHHLIAHYKVHQTADSNTDSLDGLVEESEESQEVIYQMVGDVPTASVVEEDDGCFLEINEDDHIDGILVVDDEDGNAQAIYGTDYVVGVAEESADMVF